MHTILGLCTAMGPSNTSSMSGMLPIASSGPSPFKELVEFNASPGALL